MPNIHMKFVDDMSCAQSLNIKNCLIPNPNPNPARPLNYHDRTHHLLPTALCTLQSQLDKLEDYCRSNQMLINRSKTKVMLFNTARKYDGMLS